MGCEIKFIPMIYRFALCNTCHYWAILSQFRDPQVSMCLDDSSVAGIQSPSSLPTPIVIFLAASLGTDPVAFHSSWSPELPCAFARSISY